MVCDKDMCERGVLYVEEAAAEEEERDPGGTNPKTRTPHKDVGKNSKPLHSMPLAMFQNHLTNLLICHTHLSTSCLQDTNTSQAKASLRDSTDVRAV